MTLNRAATCLSIALLAAACGGEAEPAKAPSPDPSGTSVAVAPSMSATAPSVTATAVSAPPPPEKRPLPELQREAVKGMLAAFAAHDAKKVAALYSNDVVSGAPGPTGWVEEKGRAAVESGHTSLFAGFPDMKWLSPRVFVKGNVVIQEWVSNATHTGDMGDMRASGKPTGIHGVSVYWFDDEGQITKDHTYYDGLTISVQTGAMNGKARAIPALPKGDPEWITAAGTPEEDKRIEAAKAMYAAFTGKDEKAFTSMLDKDALHVAYAQPDDKKGVKAAAEGHKSMHKAFPGFESKVVHAWAFGDRVVAEVALSGTHTGALGGLKPTKKAFTTHSLDILTFGKDGKIVSLHSYGSTAELLGQLGALDALKKAPSKKK